MPSERPLGETPVRQSTPLVAISSIASKTSWPTPVHSSTMSGVKPVAVYVAVVVGRADRCNKLGFYTRGHLVENMDFQSTLCAEQGGEQADRAGTGYQEMRGSHLARPPIRKIWSQAFATTVVGSNRTPRSPREGATFTRKSGVIR